MTRIEEMERAAEIVSTIREELRLDRQELKAELITSSAGLPGAAVLEVHGRGLLLDLEGEFPCGRWFPTAAEARAEAELEAIQNAGMEAGYDEGIDEKIMLDATGLEPLPDDPDNMLDFPRRMA